MGHYDTFGEIVLEVDGVMMKLNKEETRHRKGMSNLNGFCQTWVDLLPLVYKAFTLLLSGL